MVNIHVLLLAFSYGWFCTRTGMLSSCKRLYVPQNLKFILFGPLNKSLPILGLNHHFSQVMISFLEKEIKKKHIISFQTTEIIIRKQL